jgi:hypothetical protein
VDVGRCRASALIAAAALLLLPGAAGAATLAVDPQGVLTIVAVAGERNAVELDGALPPHPAGSLTVLDSGAPLAIDPSAGACAPFGDGAICPAATVRVELGDMDDSLASTLDTPLEVKGGSGDDALFGGAGPDVLLGDSGADSADGGEGDDVLELRDRRSDSALCGAGRDSVRAEVLDALDFECEVVDFGRAGRAGRVRAVRSGGRFVSIPGQPGEYIDRRILPNVLHLIQRYKLRITDGYALCCHKRLGEHPLGLAVDIVPGPGGSWAKVGRLARWAEPRRNRPRPPFRWVGYNGDVDHGDPAHCRLRYGCPPHLHLSWAHSPGIFGRPVRSVWVFDVLDLQR